MENLIRNLLALLVVFGVLWLIWKKVSIPPEIPLSEALGSLEELDRDTRRWIEPVEAFELKRTPVLGEWEDLHKELGQSFDDYVDSAYRVLGERKRIYLQPVGSFDFDLTFLVEYSEIYYGLETVLQEPVDGLEGVRSRNHPRDGLHQWMSGDVMKWLAKGLPEDAYCRVAITMTDLYPFALSHYIFGDASPNRRVGVYSFARFGDDDTARFKRRCLQVFSHETGHLFGMYHCVFYECLMGGSNHLEESDGSPLHLCPVCLRKLHHAVPSTDLESRYESLLPFYERHELAAESEWMTRRLLEVSR